MAFSAIVLIFFVFLFLLTGCSKTAETPQEQLAARNLAYNAETFLSSAEKGDLVAVNLFLAAGIDPNVKDQYGETALHYAAAPRRRNRS